MRNTVTGLKQFSTCSTTNRWSDVTHASLRRNQCNEKWKIASGQQTAVINTIEQTMYGNTLKVSHSRSNPPWFSFVIQLNKFKYKTLCFTFTYSSVLEKSSYLTAFYLRNKKIGLWYFVGFVNLVNFKFGKHYLDPCVNKNNS